MVLKSFAKINLSLLVNRKLPNGMHDIQSAYCLINIFDLINIKKIKNSKKDKVSITGSNSKFVSPSQNSVGKILILMRKFKLISSYYDVKIYKRIPVFAGLGGGTSNAASVLKFFIKNKIEDKLLNKIIKHLGSDLRLFFQNQGYLQNLNKLDKFKRKYNLHFLVIHTKIKCSTKKIYSGVKNFSEKEKLFQNKIKSKRKFIAHLINSRNDLQSVVEKKYPIIQKLLSDIIKFKGCYLSRMTGSGSSCYGLFANEKCSKAALKKLREKYPKFSFSIAKTI